MARYDYDLGIVGGGAAGLTVAAGAARLGARTLLVEREDRLGGDCLHFGCVPSKTLIATAGLRHAMGHASRLGLPAVELPPVDFTAVAARIREVIAAIQEHDSVERFCSLGARVVFGPCRFLDDHQAAVAGRRVSAARWVVATGSGPVLPEVPGADGVGLLTNREIFSLEALPGHLIVLGAGPVAVEMAQAFRRLGSEVTLLHRGERILSRDDAGLAGELQAALAAEGVRFVLNARLTGFERANGRTVVRYEHDGRAEILAGDAVLAALGRRPNTAELNLDAAGVAHGPGGVAVDGRMRTSRPHIFACGDVTGAYQFTHAAGYEAGVVVANAVFRLPRKADYTYFPWCTYADPELACLGLTEARAAEAGLECEVWTEPFAGNDRARAEGDTRGRLKLLVGPRGRPLGVQILGHGAGELLTGWVSALAGKTSLTALAGAVYPYPTRGESAKAVAGRILAGTVFSPTVRKALGLFFGLRGQACATCNPEE